MFRLFAKISTLTGARLFGAACGFLTALLITRHVGTEALALYAVSLSSAALVALFLVLGLPAFAQMLTAEYQARNQPGKILGLALTGFVLLLILGSALAAAVVVFGDAIQPLIPSLGHSGLIAVAVIAPGAALLTLNGSILGGLQRQVAAQLPESLMRPVTMLALLVGAILAGVAPSGTSLLVLAAIVVWAAALAQLVFLWRGIAALGPGGGLPRPQLDLARWRELAPTWFSISLVSDYVIEFHLIAAAFFLAPAEVALLHVCFRIRLLAGLGMRSIYSIFQPKLFHAMASADDARTRDTVAMTNWLSVGYSVCALVGLALLGSLVLSVFDPSFTQGHGLLMLISLAFLVRSAFGPAMSILASHREQRTILAILGTSLALSAGLVVTLTPQLGVLAIGIAYTSGLTVNAVAAWLVVRRRWDLNTAVWASGRPRLAPFAALLQKPPAPAADPPR